uniref:Uracil phosphoribosyltransferase n=1 Tax=Renouxia sp. TaxID=2485823 RepID=A0A3G3MH87_9FLOR|nr:uracil phosphoribosyltransferase [Renouxia sp.]
MKLNIYTVTHPIIQQLVSILKNKNTHPIIYDRTSQHLSIFLIYETIRNWFKNQELYIKELNITKKLSLANPQESCIVITNIPQNLNLIQELQEFIPNCQINFVNLCKINEKWEVNSKFNFIPLDINNNKKIIILDKNIQTEAIITLINYLTIKKVEINQIRISSITCSTHTLKVLGNKYPKLNIYTTEIIENYTESLVI